jgi:hypothetical protein
MKDSYKLYKKYKYLYKNLKGGNLLIGRIINVNAIFNILKAAYSPIDNKDKYEEFRKEYQKCLKDIPTLIIPLFFKKDKKKPLLKFNDNDYTVEADYKTEFNIEKFTSYFDKISRMLNSIGLRDDIKPYDPIIEKIKEISSMSAEDKPDDKITDFLKLDSDITLTNKDGQVFKQSNFQALNIFLKEIPNSIKEMLKNKKGLLIEKLDILTTSDPDCLTYSDPHWLGDTPCIRRKGHGVRQSCSKATQNEEHKRRNSLIYNNKCYSLSCYKKQIRNGLRCTPRAIYKKEYREPGNPDVLNQQGQNKIDELDLEYFKLCPDDGRHESAKPEIIDYKIQNNLQHFRPHSSNDYYKKSICKSYDSDLEYVINTLPDQYDACVKARTERSNIYEESPLPGDRNFNRWDNHRHPIHLMKKNKKLCEIIHKISKLIPLNMGDRYRVRYKQHNSDNWTPGAWKPYEGFYFDNTLGFIFKYQRSNEKDPVINLLDPLLHPHTIIQINALEQTFREEYNKEKEDILSLDSDADPEQEEYSEKILETD